MRGCGVIRRLLRPFFSGSVPPESGDVEVGCFAQEAWGGRVGIVESVTPPKLKEQPVVVIAFGRDERAILPANMLRRVRPNQGSSFDSRLGKPKP